MTAPRLSISWTTGLVLVAAAGSAAVRAGTPDAYRAVYTLTALTLTAAAVAARDGGPFWYGFAVAGWATFLLGLGPWFGPIGFPYGTFPRGLISSAWLYDLCGRLIRSADLPPLAAEPGALRELNRVANTAGILHALSSLALAWVGGIIAARLAERAVRQSAPAPDAVRGEEGG